METELELALVDVARVNLKNGDTLLVTIKSDLLTHDDIRRLSQSFKQVFPNNKVAVINVEATGDVKYAVAEMEQKSYCNDCTCGKKPEGV